MGNIVKIACQVDECVPIGVLNPFQKDLKSLSKENYAKLKRSIVHHGITMPIHVWEDNQKLWILDGHQRKLVLETLQNEGYDIPSIPIIRVKAPNYKEAKAILLTMVSQYGHVESQGLYEFMNDSDMNIEFLTDTFDIPHIDIDDFKDEYFQEIEMKQDENIYHQTFKVVLEFEEQAFNLFSNQSKMLIKQMNLKKDDLSQLFLELILAKTS